VPKSKLILVVDDETDILNLLDYNLRKAGFTVILARDGPEAIALASSRGPDVVILDIMLPDMEGTEVLRRLKAAPSTAAIPVVMLTAKGEEVDRVVGLELGAEDYITKPFSPRELLLRVRAILKRCALAPGAPADKAASLGDVSIDFQRHRVSVKGREATLTSTEFRLLKAIVEARGRVLSRDSLLDMAWGIDCHVTERTVDTHVRRLRAKLRGSGGLIETVRGAGYRLRRDHDE
jgi:two-component system phosphate regulon response regulator PhoB